MNRLVFVLLLPSCYGGYSSMPPAPGDDGDGPRVDMGGGDGSGDITIPDDSDSAPLPLGSGLCAPCSVQADCDPGLCVRNASTGERFCTEPCDRGSCDAGSSCRDLGRDLPLQCLPDGDTCESTGGGTDPIDPDPTDPDPGDGGDGALLPEMQEEERQLFDLMNEDRAASGRNCGDLEWNEGAARVAQRWSEHMADSGMYHNGNLFDELSAEGVDYTSAGENIAWAGSVQEAEEMFMSEGPGGGHYEAILSCDFDAVGVGVAHDGNGMVMVVQDFVGFGGGGGGGW